MPPHAQKRYEADNAWAEQWGGKVDAADAYLVEGKNPCKPEDVTGVLPSGYIVGAIDQRVGAFTANPKRDPSTLLIEASTRQNRVTSARYEKFAAACKRLAGLAVHRLHSY